MFLVKMETVSEFFLKIMVEFDNFMQNKTSKYIEMSIFVCLEYILSDSTSFWSKLARKTEYETLHYCETLL